MKPFFAAYCVKCHGHAKQESDFRVDELQTDADAHQFVNAWAEVRERLNAGEMPPEGERQPTAEELFQISTWISGYLAEAEARKLAAAGPVAFRRLSNAEYGHTVKDLLGVTFEADGPGGLPADAEWQGFRRIDSIMTISPRHFEEYIAAAERVLDEALSLKPKPERRVIHWDPFIFRGTVWKWNDKIEQEFRSQGLLDKIRVAIGPNNFATARAHFQTPLEIETPGEYDVRIQLSALRPEGGIPPRLRVYAFNLGREFYVSDVEAPVDEPMLITFRTHLPAGQHGIHVQNTVPGPSPFAAVSRSDGTRPFTDFDSRSPWQLKLTDDNFKPLWPFILLDYVEWEGPILEDWPTPAHKQIFFGGESAGPTDAYARDILSRFVSRAFRRPVRGDELDRLMSLFASSRNEGETFEQAVSTALVAILSSKSFLFLEEGDAAVARDRLNDWELASRLSYFLWSSMPDERLFTLAEQGTLHQPDVLRSEFRRMLSDPKSARFAASFPQEWLQLATLEELSPNKKLYPDFDDHLRKSMTAETVAFFREVFDQDLSIREFLSSDWTMLDWRLARHYGIPHVGSFDLERVPLNADERQQRGGLLTQASILSMTSDGSRRRPVHRGKWVLESLFNQPPPPPPGNVTPLETDTKVAANLTLRKQVEAHRSNVKCASCHWKIDPFGMAFETYDAIGRWQTSEKSTTAGQRISVDASGELADGRRFQDAGELKQLLLEDVDTFAIAFTEKLATYALRRGLTFADRARIAQIAGQARNDDYQIRELMEALVFSDLFQTR